MNFDQFLIQKEIIYLAGGAGAPEVIALREWAPEPDEHGGVVLRLDALGDD